MRIALRSSSAVSLAARVSCRFAISVAVPALALVSAASAVALGAGVVGCSTTERVVVSSQAPTVPPGLHGACRPQTMPTVDGASCAAVGPTSIPDGFEAAPDGWGFRAIRPAAACTGATRAVLGQTSCVPLDDCSAAFPPAGASMVVTPNGGTTLTDAIQGAPIGGLVAVDSGTYTLSAHAGMLARANVRVIGRCARDVIIQGDGTNAALGVPHGHIAVESVTLRNFDTAIALSGDTSSIDLRHVYLEANGEAVSAVLSSQATLFQSVIDGVGRAKVSSDPIRAVVAQSKSKIDVLESEVRDATRAFTAFDLGSSVTVRRTVATTRISGDDIFVLAMVGGAISIDESAVASERIPLLNAGRSRRYSKVATDPAIVKIHASEVSQTGVYLNGTTMGVAGGGTLDVEESTVRYSSNLGLSIFESGSHATFRASAFVADDAKGQQIYGMSAIQGAQLALDGTAVVGARGLGVSANDEGTLLSLSSSLVTGTVAAASATSGSASAIAVLVMKNAHATITDSAIAGNEQAGLVMANDAMVDAEGLVVDQTATDAEGALGEGIYVADDARLALRASSVRRSAWLGLIVMRASGSVGSTRFADNVAGAVNVWETSVSRPAAATDPKTRELVLTTDDTFSGSGPEVLEGSVDVALPSGPVAPSDL